MCRESHLFLLHLVIVSALIRLSVARGGTIVPQVAHYKIGGTFGGTLSGTFGGTLSGTLHKFSL